MVFVSKTKVGKTTEGSNPPLSSAPTGADVLEACKSQAFAAENKVVQFKTR
jgi:hypothetical protein